MVVALIPVIEIGYNNQGVAVPDKYPYWENAELWNKYHEACFSKAGFEDYLPPYSPGSSFFTVKDITDNNLVKLTIDHTETIRGGEFERQQASAFFGGYVLRVNEEDKFFPQCCGELSDIIYWEKLAEGKGSYYEGHPAPEVEIQNDYIVLNFSVKEFDEPFQPIPPDSKLIINKKALSNAVKKVQLELELFAQRLIKIGIEENLNLGNIDELLIWKDRRYE